MSEQRAKRRFFLVVMAMLLGAAVCLPAYFSRQMSEQSVGTRVSVPRGMIAGVETGVPATPDEQENYTPAGSAEEIRFEGLRLE